MRKGDTKLLKTASAGREILAIPEIVKSYLFYFLGKFHKKQGDYFTATSDFFYAMFHASVAIYKVHYETKIDPQVEFEPTAITVKRREVTRFIDKLAKAGLLSTDFRRMYESLQKRRDHISYQPRVIMSGKKKETITFFACQYGNLIVDIDDAEVRLPSLILESVEMIGNILHQYHLNDEFRDITAILYFKNWAKVCLTIYRYWGAVVTSELEGTELSWDSRFKYNISDKRRMAIIPKTVWQEAETTVENALELLKTIFLKPAPK